MFVYFSSSFGSHVIDDSRKWCSLFVDFENDLFEDLANATPNTKALTFALWSRVIAFIRKQQEIENEKLIPRELDITDVSPSSANNKRSLMPIKSRDLARDCDKLSLNSSLLSFDKLELSRNHSRSEDTLNGLDYSNFDLLSTFSKLTNLTADDNVHHSYSTLLDVKENCNNNLAFDSFNDSALSNSILMDDW